MEENLNYGNSTPLDVSADHFSEDMFITSTMRENLTTTSKWTMFLSIVSFVFIGLMLLGGIFVASLGNVLEQYSESQTLPFSQFPAVLGLFYILMAAIVFFPTLYLYQFSSKTKSALISSDQMQLEEGIRFGKKCAKYNGILTIILISFYLLMIPIMIIAGVAGAIFAGL